MCYFFDCIGAYDSIRDSHNRSINAQRKVDSSDVILDRSEDVRDEVDKLIQEHTDNFEQEFDENQEQLEDLNNDLNKVNGKITDLNNIVSPCPGDMFFHL